MGLYRYEAVDNTGKVVRGAMDVRDENQLTQKLAQMGYAAKAIYPPSGAGTSTQSVSRTSMRSAATSHGKVPISVKSSVSAAALAMFFRQFATMVRSGRPLFQSATDIRVSNRKIRSVMPAIQESIRSGKKLSGAMAEYPGLFPVHAVASIWAGELAGKLEIALDEVASDFEQEAKDTRYGRIGWGITKLTLILFIIQAPFLNLNTMLTAVAGKGLPTVQQYFTQGFKSIIPVIIGLFIAWEVWGCIKRIPAVRHGLDIAILKAPIWGKVHRFAAISRFFHVMDALMSAGLSSDAAWDAACLTPRNNEIARKLKTARQMAPANSGIVALLDQSGVFEMDDIGLVAAGEKSGSLPEAMLKVSEYYADRASTQKTVGKFWSIMLLMILQAVLTVLAFYFMAAGYRDYLLPFLNM